jgi:hypothetical protein
MKDLWILIGEWLIPRVTLRFTWDTPLSSIEDSIRGTQRMSSPVCLPVGST